LPSYMPHRLQFGTVSEECKRVTRSIPLFSKTIEITTADLSSVAGDYPTVVKNAQATNRAIRYINGPLTVTRPLKSPRSFKRLSNLKSHGLPMIHWCRPGISTPRYRQPAIDKPPRPCPKKRSGRTGNLSITKPTLV